MLKCIEVSRQWKYGETLKINALYLQKNKTPKIRCVDVLGSTSLIKSHKAIMKQLDESASV